MRIKRWELVWVEDMPRVLEDGKVYVSIVHTLTEHLCACGCGEEISLRLSPSDWQITYDGETISISPSIGNWQLPCRSHYFIINNRTVEGEEWTEDKILTERKQHKRQKAHGLRKNRWKRRLARWTRR